MNALYIVLLTLAGLYVYTAEAKAPNIVVSVRVDGSKIPPNSCELTMVCGWGFVSHPVSRMVLKAIGP